MCEGIRRNTASFAPARSKKRVGRRRGIKTLRTQDTSDPRHFGTIRLVPKCPNSSAPMPKCLSNTSALVPNCLDLDNTCENADVRSNAFFTLSLETR